MVYKIDSLALLNSIVQDSESFKHFFKLSLSKMRHHHFMKTHIDEIENHKNCHDKEQRPVKHKDCIPLYDLIHVFQKKYGPTNP